MTLTYEPVRSGSDRLALMTAGTSRVARDTGRATRTIEEIRSEHPVVVIDDNGEGALVFAAEAATATLVAFAVRHTSGYLCVAMTADHLRRLDIPTMPHTNCDSSAPGFMVTVDARQHITTGISAADRCRTMRLLADPETVASDLTRPGHVSPVIASGAGVVGHAGIAEAASDLARLAGKVPAAAFGHLVSPHDDRRLARRDELITFAIEHGLAWCLVGDLVAHRKRSERQLRRIAEVPVPTPYGSCRAVTFAEPRTGTEHVAIVYGDVHCGSEVLTSIHPECVVGDVFGSVRCACRARLDAAHSVIGSVGRGVLLYLRGGEPDDAVNHKTRDMSMLAAQMLTELGVSGVGLMVNGPAEVWALHDHGIDVVRRINTPVLRDQACVGAGVARAVQ